jgi:cation:H+ antiporter
LVLGAGALVSSDGLSISPNALAFDLPVMLAVFAACLPIFFSGYRINRWEGTMFLGYYFAYTLYLVMFSTGLPAINLLRHAMTWYVLPLTVVTLLVIFLRAWKHQR